MGHTGVQGRTLGVPMQSYGKYEPIFEAISLHCCAEFFLRVNQMYCYSAMAASMQNAKYTASMPADSTHSMVIKIYSIAR